MHLFVLKCYYFHLKQDFFLYINVQYSKSKDELLASMNFTNNRYAHKNSSAHAQSGLIHFCFWWCDLQWQDWMETSAYC